MKSLRNKVQLIGNLGQKPEIVQFENGNKLARLSLATNETYRNAKGEKQVDTQWHNLIAWGKTADIIEKYVEKGQEVAIEGKLLYETYEAKDGTKKTSTKIQVNELVMLGKK
ncbi:MAG: single-stranded DNA-binding protein [Putridiphycobacter sp.]